MKHPFPLKSGFFQLLSAITLAQSSLIILYLSQKVNPVVNFRLFFFRSLASSRKSTTGQIFIYSVF